MLECTYKIYIKLNVGQKRKKNHVIKRQHYFPM